MSSTVYKATEELTAMQANCQSERRSHGSAMGLSNNVSIDELC